jgi:dimethylaniline monooxygenase (N-oxide forming)
MIEVNGQSVHFAGGSVDDVDAIIFGTGYDLNLPFLSAAIRQTLDIFHLDLPGLSFAGMFDQFRSA